MIPGLTGIQTSGPILGRRGDIRKTVVLPLASVTKCIDQQRESRVRAQKPKKRLRQQHSRLCPETALDRFRNVAKTLGEGPI
jgi:hypothetical protein